MSGLGGRSRGAFVCSCNASIIKIMPRVSSAQQLSKFWRTRCRSSWATSLQITRTNSREAAPTVLNVEVLVTVTSHRAQHHVNRCAAALIWMVISERTENLQEIDDAL